MPQYKASERLPYSAVALFDLVSDVERYPAFLPWVQSIQIVKKMPNQLTADVRVGYKLIEDSYRCVIDLTPHTQIRVTHVDGPFSHLITDWQFQPVDSACTEVSFFIDFELKSFLLKRLMDPLFMTAAEKMLGAFKERARVLKAAQPDNPC